MVQFEHAFEDDTSIYILTEYCPGSTLFSYLQNNFPTGLSEFEARPIFLSLVQAVAFLHYNGILHRDLKLTNVLLTDTLQVRIADFGLATKLEDASEDQEMTMCGTPNYISPEIVKRLPYGLASDVWSLGCMLITLLTGRPPFQGDNISETFQLVARGVHRPLPRGSTRDVKHLVDLILQVDPSRRPRAADLLVHPFLASAAAQKDMQSASLSDPYYALRNDNRVKSPPISSNNPFRRMPLLPKPPRAHESFYADARRGSDNNGYDQRVERLRNPNARDRASNQFDLEVTTRAPEVYRRNSPPATESISSYSSEGVDPYQKHRQVLTRPGEQCYNERRYNDLPGRMEAHHIDRDRFSQNEPAIRHRKQASEYQPAQMRNSARHSRHRSSGDTMIDQAQVADAPRQHHNFSLPQTELRRTTVDSIHSSEFDVGPQPQAQQRTRFRSPTKPASDSNNFVDAIEDLADQDSHAALTPRQVPDSSEQFVDKYRFNTIDLKPTKQGTKHGDVAILDSGEVSVSFNKESRTYIISSDGGRITTNEQGFDKTYSLEDLPAKYILAYRYASKFVKLVRARTVRIALDSASAKCRLYYNETFEVVLNKHKRKISFCPDTGTAKIADHDAVLWKGHLDTVNPEMRDLVRQGLVWWGRCKDALREPGEDTTPSEPALNARFVEGQGWCEKRDDGNTWVFFFLDGLSMELLSDTRTATITRPDNSKETYKLERGLPDPIRKKLKIASRAMRQFV